MLAIILITWNLINLIGGGDRDNGGGEDAKVATIQPSANSSSIINSVQLSDLRFMVFFQFSSYSMFIFYSTV